MERRDLLKIFSVGTLAAMSSQLSWRSVSESGALSIAPLEDMGTSASELIASMQMMSTPAPQVSEYLKAFQSAAPELKALAEADTQNPNVQAPIVATTASPVLTQYLERMRNHELSHLEDKYLRRDQFAVLISTFKRLDRVQNLIGHGNFNVVGLDETLSYAKCYASIGQFTKAEKLFIEELFSANAAQYGFFGEKVITRLTDRVSDKDRQKIGQTGHFLYRGESVAAYNQVKRDIGPTIVLTSGIRSVVKQTHLFLAKAIQSKGNLSKASRSLAPPGHSYHGVGDFDVGKIGFGRKNFSEAFASTEEFKRLVELGYVDIRYPRDNMFGVRYEPWHIKVV